MGELFHLWQLWWSGQQVHDEMLWGYTVWSWARIGKVLQAAGVATVVLELVGPKRIANAQASAGRWRGLHVVRSNGISFDVLPEAGEYGGIAMLLVGGAAFSSLFLLVDAILAFIVFALFVSTLALGFQSSSNWGLAVAAPSLIVGTVFGGAIVIVVRWLLAFAHWLLNYRRTRWILTLFSTVAILVGTSFDLLAS